MKKTFTILFLFISLMVQATDKYIATAANGGSNSNDGSVGSPWLTLTYACAHATTSGDIIHVNAGTYIETAHCVVAVGISIVGDGVTSYIKSHYVSTSEYDGAIYLKSSSGASTDGNQSISYIKLDGDGLTATRAIGVNYRNNVEIHHCTIINFNYSGVGLQGSTNSYPSVTSTYHSTGNSVHDCIITNCSSMDVTTLGALRCSGQDGMLIYNNILDQTGRATDHNGDTFTSLWLKGVKIYNNVFYRNNEPNQWNFFSELFFTEGGMEIYNNTFNGIANLDLVDIRKGSYAFGVKIYNNESAPKSKKHVIARHEAISYH